MTPHAQECFFQFQQGRVSLTLSAHRLGEDVSVLIYGGSQPHIGAVALAEPFFCAAPVAHNSASSSVLTVRGHREDALARDVAVRLAKVLNVTVCAACGVHLENITTDEIQLVESGVEELVQKLLHSAFCLGVD